MVAESDLVERARAGEEKAFVELVRAHEIRLRAYARSMVRNEQDAEDLTQEALFKIYRALPFFQGQSSFATWAFRILNHLCLDHLRQQRRRPRCDEYRIGIEEEPELPAPNPGPEEKCLQEELRAYLRDALERLPAEQRAVVVLHDVCSFKYREIAGICRCSVGTVKSRLFTARTRLRDLIGLDAG